MDIKTHEINNLKIAEIVSDEIIISSAEDGLNLLGALYFDGFDKIILLEKNITHDFFNLKTRMAGEILQKFSNYRMALAIVGHFSAYQSDSLKSFIIECNRLGQINFVASVDEAIGQ
jgi:hypothetical protein